MPAKSFAQRLEYVVFADGEKEARMTARLLLHGKVEHASLLYHHATTEGKPYSAATENPVKNIKTE